jgi:hypothetical protein
MNRAWVVFVLVAASLFLLACSGKTGVQSNVKSSSRVVWVAKDGFVSRSYTVSNQTLEDTQGDRLPQPGDVVLFRSDMTIHGTTGKPGEAYQVEAGNRLRKIGDFSLTKTDEELVKEYQKE